MICVQEGTGSGKDGGKKKGKNAAEDSGGRAEVSNYIVRKVLLLLDLVFQEHESCTCVDLCHLKATKIVFWFLLLLFLFVVVFFVMTLFKTQIP